MVYLDRRTCFIFRQKNIRTCFFIKTSEHENKREGEGLIEQKENMRFGWACPTLVACVSSLNYWIFHSSLFTLHLNHWIFHFSLFTFLFHYGSPSHLTIISTSLVDSHLTFFLYPCSTSAWCSSGQRLTHIINRFTATCGSVLGK